MAQMKAYTILMKNWALIKKWCHLCNRFPKRCTCGKSQNLESQTTSRFSRQIQMRPTVPVGGLNAGGLGTDLIMSRGHTRLWPLPTCQDGPAGGKDQTAPYYDPHGPFSRTSSPTVLSKCCG